MDLANQMHQNNKRSRKVPEAMIRNIITTIEWFLSSENFDEATLLRRCIELQVMYFIDNRSIRALESKKDPLKRLLDEQLEDSIPFIWDEIEEIICKSQIVVDNECKDILHTSFNVQPNVVHHITDGLASMEELVKILQEFNLTLPAPVIFESRFKSYRSFLVKMLQKYEKNDLLDLMSYHDFLAFKIVLMTYNGQEKQAISDAYALFNDTIKLMLSQSYNLVPLKSVGDPDIRVSEIWAPFVKDYIRNPKVRYDITMPDGKIVEVFSKKEIKNIISKYPENLLKVKKKILYRALHAAFEKNGNDIEGQVTTDDLVKGIRSHDTFKRSSRGRLDDIFNVSEYRLEGFKCGEETTDFYYFNRHKLIHNLPLRP